MKTPALVLDPTAYCLCVTSKSTVRPQRAMGKKKKKAPLPPPPPPVESDDDGDYASLYDTPEVEPAAAAPAEQQTEQSLGSEGKKSKAQKRREKKEAEEEARDREIAEQSAVASVESRAAVERAALTSKLAELQRRVKVTSALNCSWDGAILRGYILDVFMSASAPTAGCVVGNIAQWALSVRFGGTPAGGARHGAYTR